MKILTTLVNDHSKQSDGKGVCFTKSYKQLSESFKALLQDHVPILADDGVGNKLILWNTANCMIFANARCWTKKENAKPIRFSVLFFKSKEQLALEDMGICQTHRTDINARQLYADLLKTYDTLGISNWIESGAPPGIRTMVAYQHGYVVDKAFNDALSIALSQADSWMLFNLTQVHIEEELHNEN